MQITDYDINARNNTFTIERDDVQWGEVEIKEFFRFMAETKGWTYDKEYNYLVLPLDKVEVKVLTFERFCKTYSLELPGFFTAFANHHNNLVNWDEAEEHDNDEDAQEEAWRDFRCAQML